ncbi:MAG: ATP-binding cassette domain-containing protein [Planctomycetota bacterium]
MAARALALVEKILAGDEKLSNGWPVAGTVGYDFATAASGVFVDPRGLEELAATYRRFTGNREAFEDLAFTRAAVARCRARPWSGAHDMGVIETRGLSRRFGSTDAVRQLDLRVRAGEIYGFLGPNGAGKTTAIRMLCGLLRPTAGTIRIGDVDLAAEPMKVRAMIGLVPDTPPLYDYLTAVEYIGFVASLYRLPAAVRDAGAERFLSTFGLADRRDDLCKSFSHGMRKKLHLAAMLTVAPRLLILDEPTNGLDPKSARVLKDVLGEVRDEGATVFFSTHVLATAEQICDRIGILDAGRLLAEGTLQELRARDSSESLEDVILKLTDAATENHDAG